MYVCMHSCMHVCMYACMSVCMYACMHASLYVVCMYVCMRVCIYIYIYIYRERERAPAGTTMSGTSSLTWPASRTPPQKQRHLACWMLPRASARLMCLLQQYPQAVSLRLTLALRPPTRGTPATTAQRRCAGASGPPTAATSKHSARRALTTSLWCGRAGAASTRQRPPCLQAWRSRRPGGAGSRSMSGSCGARGPRSGPRWRGAQLPCCVHASRLRPGDVVRPFFLKMCCF